MLYRSLRVVSVLSVLCFAACATQEGPFVSFEMCLKDHAGVSAFLNEVKAIACEEGMTLVDRRAGSQHV
jgi:hypothetical protein